MGGSSAGGSGREELLAAQEERERLAEMRRMNEIERFSRGRRALLGTAGTSDENVSAPLIVGGFGQF